jgi:hypothetical protein
MKLVRMSQVRTIPAKGPEAHLSQIEWSKSVPYKHFKSSGKFENIQICFSWSKTKLNDKENRGLLVILLGDY